MGVPAILVGEWAYKIAGGIAGQNVEQLPAFEHLSVKEQAMWEAVTRFAGDVLSHDPDSGVVPDLALVAAKYGPDWRPPRLRGAG